MNVTELIERLRYGVEHYDDRDDAVMTRAADALEAQAREIEELKERFYASNRALAAAERGWERECADGDAVLCALGVAPQDYRTGGGSLNLPKIRDRLRAEKAAIALMRKGEATLLGETNEALSACQSEGQGWKSLALNLAVFVARLSKSLPEDKGALRRQAMEYLRAHSLVRLLRDDAVVTRTAWYGAKELQADSEDMGLYDDEPCSECGMKPAFDGMWHKPGCGAVNTSIHVGPFQSRADGDSGGGQET